MSLFEQLGERATALGFDLAGAVPAQPWAELAQFSNWVEAGYAGEMHYLKSTNEAGVYKRESLRDALPWAKSAIVCATNYNTAPAYSVDQSANQNGSARGWISRYAWTAESVGGQNGEPELQPTVATDYHNSVLARLRTLEAWLHENALKYGVGEAIQSR